MKKLKKLVIFLLMVSGTFYGQSKPEKKMQKSEIAHNEYANTKAIINSGEFVFTADRMIPSGGGSISLVTNPNQIKFHDGTADIHLPYFGEGWGGGGYNHDPGIRYKGEVSGYEVSHNDNKRKTRIEFDIKNGSETHNFGFTTGRNGYTSVLVKSSGRTTITYDGYLKPAEEAWE
jgi:hypothetical protein